MVILAFLLLLVVLVGCLCSLWGRPSEGIGIPVIAIATFGFIYFCQPAYMVWSGDFDYFLTGAMAVKGLLLPAVALLCLMWGWRRGEHRLGRTLPGATSEHGWSAGRLYISGLAAACVGTALHLMYVQRSGGFGQAYGQMHGHGFEATGFTAYIYMGQFWVQSGVAMMIVSGSKRRLTLAQQMAIVAFAGGLAVNGLLQGSRHDVFAICAIVWVGWSLASGSRPSIDRAAPALAIACLGALLMVGYRSVLYLSSDKPEAPTWAEAVTRDLASSDASIRSGNTGLEFVVHAAALETVDQTQKYDFALNWLPVYTVHLIPRILWPDKPPLRLAMVPDDQLGTGINLADVREVTGITPAQGSATGIVAEMYMSFGLVSLLFFIWLGGCARRLLFRAQHLRTPLPMCTYIMVFSLSLNVFGQGFGAILIPLPYSMLPVVLYHWVECLHRRRLAREALGDSLWHHASLS